MPVKSSSSLAFVPFPEDASGMPPSGVPPKRIRSYYKYELAQLYQISPETIVKYINRFLPELEKLGYRKNDKLLSKEIVRFLFSRLGEP